MKLRIEFNIDNDAFVGDCQMEIVRILGEVQKKVLTGQGSGGCLDINGNKVGDWGVEK